ncbi:dynein regulatory complex subunit 2-like [Cylas formicarius]|uniref:dynein regulatory complex subunit 2-like n=1 Tax=Cylas formicarius TaxID=197179 RepID=UPI002958CB11|nr:dynein regulatory complex subunit 2-like [Cylas formicarius]
MAGKKKKTLANKLAKMSDEDRARYLQHRAEVEEEARRRKEQLIATFMKKKIKKEEAFARLNTAKINQNWHQILRKIKVQEMKDDVDHLRKWIERTLSYKNQKISKLVEDLDEADSHYNKNFASHSTHLDEIIENQNKYIEKLQKQYETELDELLKSAKTEKETFSTNSANEIEYLKTVTYGQNSESSDFLQKRQEQFNQQLFEIKYENNAKLSQLSKTCGQTQAAIWRQIFQITKLYVQGTNTRRSHLAELQRLDAESAIEVQANEERINVEEELVSTLKSKQNELRESTELKTNDLDVEERRLNDKFIAIKKRLKTHLDVDDKKLRLMTFAANETLDLLVQLNEKGRHIVALSQTCRKFETEREKVARFIPTPKIDEVDLNIDHERNTLTDDEKLTQLTLQTDMCKIKGRPQTAIPSRFLGESSKIDSSGVPTPETVSIAPIEEVTLLQKSIDVQATSDCPVQRDTFLGKCYESLRRVENFWKMYNKVEIDIMEIKEERKVLTKENKQLRGVIRAVLEAAALKKSNPESRASARVISKSRSAYSAPCRRIVFT